MAPPPVVAMAPTFFSNRLLIMQTSVIGLGPGKWLNSMGPALDHRGIEPVDDKVVEDSRDQQTGERSRNDGFI